MALTRELLRKYPEQINLLISLTDILILDGELVSELLGIRPEHSAFGNVLN